MAKTHQEIDKLQRPNNNNEEDCATKLIKRKAKKTARQNDSEIEDKAVDKTSNNAATPGREGVGEALPTTDILVDRLLFTLMVIAFLASVIAIVMTLLMLFGNTCFGGSGETGLTKHQHGTQDSVNVIVQNTFPTLP